MKVLQFKKNVYNAHGGQLLNQEGERFIRGKPPGHTVENRGADLLGKDIRAHRLNYGGVAIAFRVGIERCSYRSRNTKSCFFLFFDWESYGEREAYIRKHLICL